MSGGNPEWANPEWDLPQTSFANPQKIGPFTCQITCSLTIVSRRPIRDLPALIRRLELWVDQYDGSYVCKPYHTLLYILLGAKLVSKNSTSRNYEYQARFQGIIKFGIKGNRNRPPANSYRVVMSEGLEDTYYAVHFECHMSESQRKGVIYSELYKLNGYHYTFPSMMELLGLEVVADEEGLIAPL